MELSADYYPYLDVSSKSEDTIFRELCTTPEYLEIKDGKWKEAFINRLGEIFYETPNVRTVANRVIQAEMKKKGYDINPEEVYFNTFSAGTLIGNEGYFHAPGWLSSSFRLTDAVLMNIFYEWYNDDWSALGSYRTCGIYDSGKDGGSYYPDHPEYGKCWGPANQICYAEVPANLMYDKQIDVQTAYDQAYKDFWGKRSKEYETMLADLFLAAAIRQYKAKLLSDYGFAMIRKVYAKQPGVKIYWFNIDEYDATDMIVIVGQVSGADHVILYIPGASIPFTEFKDYSELRVWLMEQLAEPKAKASFLKHFSFYDRQDGVSYSGVDTFVKKMLAGESGWNPQDYILLKPIEIPYDAVFNHVRHQVQTYMKIDADKLITSNSEAFRDYALNFLEVMLSQIAAIDILVPEVGIPIDLALSATILGLSSDIVIRGDSLEKRQNAVGSLVGSAIFAALTMLSVYGQVGMSLRDFRLAHDEISIFADEEEFMVRHFHLGGTDELRAIKPGDTAYLKITPDSETRLVRLADGNQPLAIIRRIAGNKFIRLNPTNLEEIEGEGLISEVLTEAGGKKRVYLSNGSLLGGAPYSPYENFFSETWTVEKLKKKADHLGTKDALYTAIKDKLAVLHASTDYDAKRLAAHELVYQINKYTELYPRASRLGVLKELAEELKDTLYEERMEFLKNRMLKDTSVNPVLASHIHKAYQSEALGLIPEDITLSLVQYARKDSVLSIGETFRFYGDPIPHDITFPVKYIIEDLDAVNSLQTEYYALPAYAAQGLTTNRQVLEYALEQSHRIGILPEWVISRTNKRLYMGHSYGEVLKSITTFSCNEGTRYTMHPKVLLDIFEDLIHGGDEKQLMKLFGTEDYFKSILEKRVVGMQKSLQLFDPSFIERFDKTVGKVFNPSFNQLTTDEARINAMMSNTPGVVIRNDKESVSFVNKYLDDFISHDVTHIGLTDFFGDIHQSEIDTFLVDGTMTTRLNTIILSLDQGEVEGPFYQLIMAAQRKRLKVVALSETDTSREIFSSNLPNTYVKGTIGMNATHLLYGKKFILVADGWLINTSPGLLNPSLGLAQLLKAPGFGYDKASLSMRFLPEAVTNRTMLQLSREPIWTGFHPGKSRFMGWRKYDENFQFVKPAEREAALFATIGTDLEGFKQEYNSIKAIANAYACGIPGKCANVAREVADALKAAGKRTGGGYSLAWWTKVVRRAYNNNHTANSVFIRDVEYVVDAAHLQFSAVDLDDPVIILPVNMWVDEILNRVKGYNPMLAYRWMDENTIKSWGSPWFTRPM